MKIKRLIIENIGKIKNTNIELDKPLILFYGEIKQGKTTILNAVKWVFGGSYPSDIIRHGEKEAKVRLEFENGSITREWYINKAGQVADRPIVFVQGGEVVKSPVAEIKKYLNPYLLDNEFFKKMTETERKQYLPGLFGVDTKELDEEAAKLEGDAKALRATIKGYGDIVPVKVDPVDAEPLKKELAAIKAKEREGQEEARRSSIDAASRLSARQTRRDTIDRLKAQITQAQKEIEECEGFLKENPVLLLTPEPEPVDTSDLENRISEAAAVNVRAEQYEKDAARYKEKEAKVADLSRLEGSLKEIKAKKIAKLKEISGSCGIPGLEFDEAGGFIYDATEAGMLSTSQIMKLSSELSALYPPGFGLELIDRGESLGKSIFEFITRAEKEEKTILATIVGESPATTPINVGVFVVEEGEVK